MQPAQNRNVVLLLLYDNDRRFLLQHRDDSAPTYPSYWGFFGGGIESGETPLIALRREVFEELRYVPSSVAPLLTIDYRDQRTGRQGKKFYLCELYSDKTALELHEGQGMGWFTPTETRSILCTESNISILEQCLSMLP